MTEVTKALGDMPLDKKAAKAARKAAKTAARAENKAYRKFYNTLEESIIEMVADAPAAGAVATERVPFTFIRQMMWYPSSRVPFLSRYVAETAEPHPATVALVARQHVQADLEQNVLRQYEEQGYAEVGVGVGDDGVRRIFLLPRATEQGH